MAVGKSALKKIILLACAVYFVAFTMPYAAWQIAIASWSSLAYAAIFTILITLAVGFVVVLLIIDYVRN